VVGYVSEAHAFEVEVDASRDCIRVITHLLETIVDDEPLATVLAPIALKFITHILPMALSCEVR
jgi:hypothetical protein